MTNQNTSNILEVIFIGILIAWLIKKIFHASPRTRIDIRKEWNETATPATKTTSAKKSIYTLKAETQTMIDMPEPTTRLFTYRDERKAFKAQQRLWMRYRDKTGHVSERTVEIYHPEDDAVVFAWCCLKKEPRTFARSSIQSWRLIPERYDFDPIVAQYWDEEGTEDVSVKLPWRRWLQQQPNNIANRYT